MRFRSAFGNFKFNVLPEDIVRDQYGRKIESIKGLYAIFDSRSHVFDSEQAQIAYRWSDAQRTEVERALLSSPRFGIMHTSDMGASAQGIPLGNQSLPQIYLAPGQEIPDEHFSFVKEQRWYRDEQEARKIQQVAPDDGRRCPAILQTINGDVECGRPVVPGDDYCDAHVPLPVSVE